MERAAKTGMQTEQWTRHEVAQLLRVSVSTVRRMEGRSLHPAVDARGVRLFAASEVRTVAVQRERQPVTRRDDEGEVAARVFKLFRDGADIREVVISARVHPRVVRELFAEWWVNLRDGEDQRRQRISDEESRRARARAEREHLQWSKALGKVSR